VQRAPDHPAGNTECLRDVLEIAAFLAHRHDGSDFIVHQCHPPVGFDRGRRYAERVQLAPDHPAANPDFVRDAREITAFLAYRHDGGDLVLHQRHPPRFLRRRQLATAFGPTRVVGDVGELGSRQLGALFRAHRAALARLDALALSGGLSVDGFAGPLDWLLEMARARKINLARLPIGALITRFAGALAAALAGRDVLQIERWAGWTVMAATLTELWSRLLLPADPAAAKAAEAEAEALRRRLLARQRMREAADWLERRPQLGRDVSPRGRAEASKFDRGSDPTELLRACLVVLNVPEAQAAAYRPRPPPLWRVTDALPHIRQRLSV
jgi:hypothetical protein